MKMVKLKDICEFQPKKAEVRALLSSSEVVSFLPMEDLDAYSKYVKPKHQRTLSEVIKGYTYFRENDILLAKITPCFENGKIGIAKDLVNGIGFGSTEYIVIRVGNEVLSEWVYQFLTLPFIREQGKELMTGAVGHKRVPKEFIENLSIPLPPVKTQIELLKKLDEKLDDISHCESMLEQQILLLRELETSTVSETLGLANERS
ncbi:hypothetical protein B9Z45_00415 [Limnohabitans sp. 2KL-17]|uniref:restriction endonuclease subunit S n=1 Tax=Limnohabitans sp. 2KL-17 TaxID=1100704 RepID=UPI000DD25483|nr:restriction endonuclease subunit S [Limnohabitans sp. 2KL-17]PUE63177.1 hypothetical protein B9Z45_00415 [Limnohabitans sp. 2KL-17]